MLVAAMRKTRLFVVRAHVLVRAWVLRNVMIERPDRRLRPILHVDLLENGLDMHLDDAVGDVELVGYLLVRGAIEQAAKDLHFTVRQAVDMADLPALAAQIYPPVGEQLSEFGREHFLAEQDEPQRRGQGVSRYVFQQVAVDAHR